MPKCPRCGAEIDHLHYECKVWEFADFYLSSYKDPDGEHFSGDWGDWDYSDSSDARPRWYCPECEPGVHRAQSRG